MSPLQRNLSVEEGARLLVHAFERGVNFLDTAELYENYAHIAMALRTHPDVVVATKCYAYDAKTAEESLIRALRELRREYVDICMLHEQESIHTLRGHAEALAYFQRRKEQGVIRALGVSTHHVACAHAARNYAELEVIHPLVNYTGLGICDGTREDMLRELDALHGLGKGVYAMKPLGGGHFMKTAKEALEYILNIKSIDSIAVGMQSVEEIDVNCAYFSGETVDAAAEAAVAERERRLLIHDWCEGCGACVSACPGKALRLEEGKALADMSKCVLCGYCAARCPQFCIKVV